MAGLNTRARLRRPQFIIEHARGRRIAAPLGESHHFENAHTAIEPDGQDIAGLHGVTGRLLAHAVDADMAGFDQRSSTAAGFHDPRMPQPLVETLALQMVPLKRLLFEHDLFGKPVPTFPDHALNQSLRLAASCSFSAANLAKGELGSTWRSRSRGLALEANGRSDGPLSRRSRPPLLSRP